MSSGQIVSVIDDDEAVRDSLQLLLAAAGYLVRTFDSARAFLEAPERHEARCVVSDVRMPGMSGLDLVATLRASGSKVRVILITGHGDVPLAVEAMKAGAADFIEKPFDHRVLLEAVAREADGPQGEPAGTSDRLGGLTQRERQVLDGLLAGKANKMIALELGISPRTVEVHRANLMVKAGASSFSELIRFALGDGPRPEGA